MNKAELVAALESRLGSRKVATEAVDAVVETITRAVARGEKVAISGFGSFEKVARNARVGRNPRTGDKVNAENSEALFLLARKRELAAVLRLGERSLDRDLGDAPEISALIASMVLGLQGETPADAKQMFQRTGTMHLFAVSGLNVAMLATIAWFLLKPLRIGRSSRKISRRASRRATARRRA